jgi:hypothetical protein
MLEVAEFGFGFDERLDCLDGALDGSWQLVDILWLDNGLQVVFEDFCEVVYPAALAQTIEAGRCWALLCNSEPRKYLNISSQSGGLSYRPKFGFNLPLRIFRAVLLPIPFVPTRPSTWPGRGMGSLCNLKLFAEYRWVTWVSRLVGRLMMWIAPKGHFFGQIPQPMHSRSEM